MASPGPARPAPRKLASASARPPTTGTPAGIPALLEGLLVVERADQGEVEVGGDHVLCHLLHALCGDFIQPGEDVLRLQDGVAEHLPPEPVDDHPLRALEPEHEPALGERARLLELFVGDALLRDLAELADDRLDGLLASRDVDAGLREDRARIGVALVVGVDVIGEAAPLAHLGEEPR